MGVWQLNISQVMWLWQFQNFTNKKPCATWLCPHSAWMGCAVVHKAPKDVA